MIFPLAFRFATTAWKVTAVVYRSATVVRNIISGGRTASSVLARRYSSLHEAVRLMQQSDVTAGMIPRAIEMIFTVSKHLQDRGWKYQMEGQFLEVYNEVVSRS